MDNQVLQRNGRNVCEVTLSGRCSVDGPLQVSAMRNGRAIQGFAAKSIGRVSGREFRCKLKGIPVGGPYGITLKVIGSDEKLVFRNILVGDVWILSGQSNMVGVGRLKDAAKSQRLVRAFYMNDRWDIARDPIHNFHQAVDQIHIDLYGGGPILPSNHVGTGPGVAFR